MARQSTLAKHEKSIKEMLEEEKVQRYKEWFNDVCSLRDQVQGNPFTVVGASTNITQDCGLTRNILTIELNRHEHAGIWFALDDEEMGSREVSVMYTTQKAKFAELLNLLRERVQTATEQKEAILGAIVADQIPEAAIARMEGAKFEISYEQLLRDKTEKVITTMANRVTGIASWHPLDTFTTDFPMKISTQKGEVEWKLVIHKMNPTTISVCVGPVYSNCSDTPLLDLIAFTTNRKIIDARFDAVLKWLRQGQNI